jgi:hypothetical protein
MCSRNSQKLWYLPTPTVFQKSNLPQQLQIPFIKGLLGAKHRVQRLWVVPFNNHSHCYDPLVQ